MNGLGIKGKNGKTCTGYITSVINISGGSRVLGKGVKINFLTGSITGEDHEISVFFFNFFL